MEGIDIQDSQDASRPLKRRAKTSSIEKFVQNTLTLRGRSPQGLNPGLSASFIGAEGRVDGGKAEV